MRKLLSQESIGLSQNCLNSHISLLGDYEVKPPPTLHLHFLGQYSIAIDGHPVPPFPTEKSRTLFAYLALHPVTHNRAHLAALFWPELPEQTARRRLSQELWRTGNALKQAGAVDILHAAGPDVRFHTECPVACDVFALTDALNGLRTPRPETWATRTQLLALYPGELLPGFFDEWVLVERERLFSRLREGLAHLLAFAKKQGNWEEAVHLVESLGQLDPLNETWAVEALGVSQALQRPEFGLQFYARLVEQMRDELDCSPTPELAALVQRHQQQTSLHGPPPLSFVDPAYQPPLIGREAERSLLLRALQQAQAGRGQICFLVGEAGVGKSRLLTFLLDDARWRGLLVGQGKSLEARRDEAYWPLLQALAQLLSPLRSQQLRLLLNPLWLAIAARSLPLLSEWLPDLPLPPPLAPEPDRIRTLEALTRLVLALAELTPTALALDDLQWADNATLDLLIYLARRIRSARLLILLSFRPAEVRQDTGVWLALQEIDRGEPAQRIELAGISAEASAELVRTLLQMDRPAPIFERRIYTRTEGNPFFILETLRTLHQEGNLTRGEGGDWQTPWDAVTVDYREAVIPREVDGLIRRRLAQLSPEERQVLDIAAVLATPFDLTQLTRFLPNAARQVLAATAALVQRHFLQETPTAYQFEHDQIRQTVYAQIDPAQRRQLHRSVGEVLEQYEPEAYTLLAYHFEQADAIGSAFRFAWKAGQAAQQSGAYRLARTHYAKAIAWLASLPAMQRTRFQLLMEWERLLNLLGERETQLEILRQLATTPGLDARQMGTVLLRQAVAHRDAGHFDAALALIGDSFAIAQEQRDEALAAEVLTVWGEVLHWRGEEKEAQSRLQEAVEAATRSANLRLQAQAWNRLADLLPALNAYTAAVEAADRALAAFQQLGDVAGAAGAQLALAVVAMERGDVQDAVTRYGSTLALAEECGFRMLEARVASNRANALCVLGQIGEALSHYARGLDIARSLDDERLYSLIFVNYAATHLSFVGRDEGLGEGAQRAIAWAEKAGDDLCLGQAWNILSLEAAYAGDLRRARAWLDRSVAAFQRVEYAYIQAQALRAQAQLCQLEGNLSQALLLIRQALDASQQIDATNLSAEMWALEAEILLDLGDLASALAAAESAAANATLNVFQSYLLHYRCARVWRAANQDDRAQAALATAFTEYSTLLSTLSPQQRQQSRRTIPAHRDLLADAGTFLGEEQL